MMGEEFHSGFILPAAGNASGAARFSRAGKEIDDLRQYRNKLGEETENPCPGKEDRDFLFIWRGPALLF